MIADLTKRYRFSASHRLHSAALTDDENLGVYGKCNNTHGHGHNYALHVTVSGPVEPETGMVLDLAALDRVVGEEVIEPFDRTFLNADLDAFRQAVPTTENLCVEIFRRLNARLMKEPSGGAARLKKILLEETSSNYFEYEG
ncbi:MAG: 6-carboxytetrahydropterin synthase [Terriglobia bacterium]